MHKLTGSTRGILCLTGLLLGWAMLDSALAQKVYESVDAEGDVTFSDTPPPPDTGTTRQIDLQPGPTPAQLQESRQQLQNLESMANEAGGTGQSQAPQPAPGDMPPAGETTEDEGNVYVEGGYADERYRDERLRQVTPGREGDGEEGLREGGAARPAGRVR